MVNVLKSKKNKIKCWYCKSKLEYEPSDIKTRKRQYTGSYEDYMEDYIVCPACDANVTIRTRHIGYGF